MDDEARREFSLVTIGPFERLARVLRLARPTGALYAWRLAAVAWLPLAVGSLIRGVAGRGVDPIMLDISVHARLLISLPLLALATQLLTAQCRVTVHLVYEGQLADAQALDGVRERAAALRDSTWIDVAFATLAITSGQLVLWGVSGPTGLFHGVQHAESSGIRFWYAGVALPLLQFLAMRWLWRWLIWSYLLLQIARLPLATLATHPDRAAGLAFLAAPISAFSSFVLGFGSVMAAAWATQLIDNRVTVPALLPTFIAFVVIAVMFACGPLLPFSVHLYRAQRRTTARYHPFALDYVRSFDRKWIGPERTADSPLGSSDIQSLADLGNSLRTIEETRMFVFGMKKLTELWLAAIVPMLPLVLAVVPVTDLLRRIGKMLFGGLLP